MLLTPNFYLQLYAICNMKLFNKLVTNTVSPQHVSGQRPNIFQLLSPEGHPAGMPTLPLTVCNFY